MSRKYQSCIIAMMMTMISSSSLFVQSFTLGSTPTSTKTIATSEGAVTTPVAAIMSSTTTTTTYLSLAMRGGGVRSRGLEQRIEGPTPTEGGMVLFVKAGEDGKSIGDCPFAHYVRMVLEEKNLDYTVRSVIEETKPNWLVDYYQGQLPALRHNKECYIESNIIVSYLDYFFPSDNKESTKESKTNLDNAEENALLELFPNVARYLKDVDDTDETYDEVTECLKKLEEHFQKLCATNEDNNNDELEWCYLDGTKTNFSQLDCRIIPQLYHLSVGIEEFKNNDHTKKPNLKDEYPFIFKYLQYGMERPSFLTTKYEPEVLIWGWNNARKIDKQQ